MSTTVAHPGITPGSGPSRRLLGVAAVGLTMVIAIGFVIAATQGDDVGPARPRPTVANVQPAHPMVSDAHRVKAEILAERRAEAAAQANANRFPMIGGASTEVPEVAQSLLSGRDTFPVFGGASTQVPEVAQSLLPGRDTFPVFGGASTQVPEVAQSLLPGRDTFPVFGGASTQVPEAAQSLNSTAGAWQAQYQEYIDFLTDRALSLPATKAMWEQRYDDLVERFHNQYTAGGGIDDTWIGYK